MASPAYEARNARARALGFRNYYDYRIRSGRLENPRPTGAALRVARGHASAADLRDWARQGGATVSRIAERDAGGRRTVVDVSYTDDRGVRQFRLRGPQVSDDYLSDLYDDLDDAGVDVDDYEPVWGAAAGG